MTCRRLCFETATSMRQERGERGSKFLSVSQSFRVHHNPRVSLISLIHSLYQPTTHLIRNTDLTHLPAYNPYIYTTPNVPYGCITLLGHYKLRYTTHHTPSSSQTTIIILSHAPSQSCIFLLSPTHSFTIIILFHTHLHNHYSVQCTAQQSLIFSTPHRTPKSLVCPTLHYNH